MQGANSSNNEKLSVDIVKMIRNNNIVIGKDGMANYDTYFMLDYFDLLFHRNLDKDEKIYREFWNIGDDQKSKTYSYKAAYKTLSLYADKGAIDEEFYKVAVDKEKVCLSSRPFLGIVQVNLVYSEYDKEPEAKDILPECEEQISKWLKKNGFLGEGEVCYQMHKSSTSGDFCLAVKSACIRDIYKISSLINNFGFKYQEEYYKFSTYTNIGIECFKDDKDYFYTFQKETVEKNSKCKFALRITTSNAFAKILFQNSIENGDIRVALEPMEGLFGRYDFLILLSMEEFSKLYAVLCESKIIGDKSASFSKIGDGFLDSFQKGVVSGDIEIINERVLVSLEDEIFEPAGEDSSCAENGKDKLKKTVEDESKRLREKVEEFQQMISWFVEERRAFIDVSRELGEVISTYIPQGVENDSHVNWWILTSDLDVVFQGIGMWREFYKNERDPAEQKAMRGQFIEELRLVVEALNQYYRFLQNVNAQTWQAPLYEIQTQLDAEKMMIAYREFLYQYLQRYKKHYDKSKDKRPMRYPIVYPDLSAERVHAMVAFQNERNLYRQLFVCKVPSFEYYGRMFDLIPWSLHEASHCIRVLSRKKRNEYLVKTVFLEIFSQAFYKLLNANSNDYGYYELGELENEVLGCIVRSAVCKFGAFCSDRGEKADELALNQLHTELLDFLCIVFEQNIDQLEKEEDAANVEEIQKALLRYLGKLGLLDEEKPKNGKQNWKNLIELSVENADALFSVLKEIYNAFYRQTTGEEPKKNEWEIVRLTGAYFEEELKKINRGLEKKGIGKEKIRDYCFNMRELNRLYGAWSKRRKGEDNKEIRDGLWCGCISEIQDKVENGFLNNQGFPELYRILNTIFYDEGAGGKDTAAAERIGKEFDRLLQEEVDILTEREVTLYRESIADIFMAEALGLNAFGYCRHMFQTASDASIENNVDWAEAINVHRFRSVAAVLLSHEPGGKVRKFGHKKRISMKTLLEEGEKYSFSTLECAKEKIEETLRETGEEEKKTSLDALFGRLEGTIESIFKCFMQPMIIIQETLEDSVLALLVDPKRFDEPCEREIEEGRKKVREEYETVKDEIKKIIHILYRIKCFISILALVGENGYIVIEEEEFEHLDALYKSYWKVCKETREEEICKVVSRYYNEPQSARDKKPSEMLEDTLQFIQTYYYRNRFKIMSSLKDYKGGEEDGEANCS
ncbi:MAG: hypothetical protein HDQ96_14100 [Lachnospiraceae bacterium]|nr:hypothetical protein [Lachnospiraceae bacterium]